MDVPEQYLIRVLLLNEANTCSLQIGSQFDIVNSNTEILQVRIDRPKEAFDISFDQDQLHFGYITFPKEPILVKTTQPNISNINGADYRGNIEIVPNSDSNTFDVINIVPIEPYLAGVVGSEMPSYWEPAALESQAVAARTYCLYIKQKFGQMRHWDLTRTQANQAYKGISAESSPVWQAINKTRSLVLMADFNNTSEIFPTYFCSACGGHTENASKVFGGDEIAPLKGVECPYCKKTAKKGFYNWNKIEYDKQTVSDKLISRYRSLEKLKKITSIKPLAKSEYNDFTRMTMIEIAGPNNITDWLRAEDFRLALDPSGMKLKSTAFEISSTKENWIFSKGRGFGHGVGLCQCGAQQLARKGKSYQQILQYFYPGCVITRLEY
jgi:stage II sporulation protein D